MNRAIRAGGGFALGAGLMLGCAGLGWGADGARPWRLGTALGAPDWLQVSGSHRVRYETLDGQFRAGGQGGDQVLALQTALRLEAGRGPAKAVFEGMDSRVYLADIGTPADNRLVNALDVLQAHLLWQDAAEGGVRYELRAGRQTLDLGSRRLVARNAFRNSINAFTGIDTLWRFEGGASVRAFYLLPVRRLPEDTDSARRNEIVADREGFDQQFWGAFADIPLKAAGARLEGYYLRLQEEAGDWLAHRHLHTPGVRLFRAPSPGRLDFEFESTVQFGMSSRGVGADGPEMQHLAHHHHAGAAFTFDARMQPRFGMRYDYASGDADPDDGDNGRFDTLFGARRWEFGPTDIFSAAARANLNSPDCFLSLKPVRNLEATLSHRWLWLAEARDAWTPGGVRDPSGASGTEVGRMLELRVRWDAKPGQVRVEGGVAYLFEGEFLRRAPNSTREGDAAFLHGEIVLMF